jgi:hypothetical protein
VRRGTTIVVDRFAFSGAAFTAAKGVPGLDIDWCRVRAGWPSPGVRDRLPGEAKEGQVTLASRQGRGCSDWMTHAVAS